MNTMDAVTKPEARTFRNILTGARVKMDVWEEVAEVDFISTAAVTSHWPASWAMSFMRSNGGFERWVEEV